MTNIYIEPQKHETSDAQALEAYMKQLFDKYKGGEKCIRNKDTFGYPYIRVSDDDLSLHLGTFYSLHYMDGTVPTLVFAYDTHAYGEKPHSEILEDAKTAVNFIESNLGEYNE